MGMTEQLEKIALEVAAEMPCCMNHVEIEDGVRWSKSELISFAGRFLAALPKPEPVGNFIPDSIERPVIWNQVKRGQGLPLYREPPIAPPASNPDDTCYDDIELAKMILSDCGCSTINNRALVDRVADRIARHKAQRTSQQNAVGKVIGRNFGCMPRVEWYDSYPESGSLLYAAPQPDYKAQRDADRYRWLRDNNKSWSWNPSQYNKEIISGFAAFNTGYLGFEFESAIDAAIASAKGAD